MGCGVARPTPPVSSLAGFAIRCSFWQAAVVDVVGLVARRATPAGFFFPVVLQLIGGEVAPPSAPVDAPPGGLPLPFLVPLSWLGLALSEAGAVAWALIPALPATPAPFPCSSILDSVQQIRNCRTILWQEKREWSSGANQNNNTVSQAYFALHETLHKFKKF